MVFYNKFKINWVFRPQVEKIEAILNEIEHIVINPDLTAGEKQEKSEALSSPYLKHLKSSKYILNREIHPYMEKINQFYNPDAYAG